MIANIYGCWKVKSPAWTPGAITEPWTANDGKKWVEVPAAKIVDRNGVVTADCAEGINEGIQEGAAEAGEGNECTTANHKHHDKTSDIWKGFDYTTHTEYTDYYQFRVPS